MKPGWQEKFIKAFRESANVRAACDAAGINRQYAYRHRSENEEFRLLWEAAEQDAVDRLELVAWERAEKQSDALMTLLLKAHRPEKYAERLIILKKAAETVKNADDTDLLALLGYDGTGAGDPPAVSAGGTGAAGEAAEE